MAQPVYLVLPTLLLSLSLTAAPALRAQQPVQAPSPPSVQAAPQPRHSTVSFRDGLLTVQASNASLNGILREIARSTGMTISGSAPEDRVFGTYGPADPQRVMSTLLDGTGTNILIVSNAADKPLELHLSPRRGGPTPPSPTSSTQDTDDSAQAPPPPPEPRESFSKPDRPLRAAPRNSSPDPSAGTSPSEVSQPVVFPSISPTSEPATGTTTPADPDNDQDPGTEGVKTPQQIFDQLQKLQNSNTGSGNSTTDQPPQQ